MFIKRTSLIKRFTAAMIAAAVIVALAGCSENGSGEQRSSDISQAEAYDKYTNAIGGINAAGSFAGETTLRVAMLMMSAPYDYTVTTGIKHIFGPGDNFQAEIIADPSVEMDSVHYKDGMFYYIGGDESEKHKFKFYFPGEEFLKTTNTRLVTEVIFPISDVFRFEANEDNGGFDFLFEMHPANMNDPLREIADFAMTGGLQEHGAEDLNYEFDDPVVTVRIDKSGNLENIIISFFLMINHMDEALETYIELGINVFKIGGVSIDFPDDLDSFVNLDEE